MNLDEEMFVKRWIRRLDNLEENVHLAWYLIEKNESRSSASEPELLTLQKEIKHNHQEMTTAVNMREGLGGTNSEKFRKIFSRSEELSKLINLYIKSYIEKFSLQVVHDETKDEYLFDYTKEKYEHYNFQKKKYLKSLQNVLTFGKCAGKLTELPLLYKAGLKFEKTRKELEPEEKYTKFWNYIDDAQKEKKLTQIKHRVFFPKFLFQNEGGKDKLKQRLAKLYEYSDPVDKNALDGLLKIVETPIPINKEVADSLNYICSKLDRLNDKTSEINNSDKYIKRTLELFGHSDEVDEIEAIGFLHDDGKDCIAKDIELKLYLRIANSPKIGSRFVKYNSDLMEFLIARHDGL